MKKALFLAIIAVSAMMVSCNKQAALTEEKEDIQAEMSQAIEAVRLANNLALYGYETESALALIQAADMLVSTPIAEMTEVSIEKGEAQGEAGQKAEKPVFTPAQLIADAKDFADGNETMMALISNVEAKMIAAEEGTRGEVSGAIEHYDRIESRATDTYILTFRAHELAEIAVIGDGDTDLDLYVYDENGNRIVYDEAYSGNCYVSFSPLWTGKFIVRIVNRGYVYNNYILLTN